jgi:hypothetical protein
VTQLVGKLLPWLELGNCAGRGQINFEDDARPRRSGSREHDKPRWDGWEFRVPEAATPGHEYDSVGALAIKGSDYSKCLPTTRPQEVQQGPRWHVNGVPVSCGWASISQQSQDKMKRKPMYPRRSTVYLYMCLSCTNTLYIRSNMTGTSIPTTGQRHPVDPWTSQPPAIRGLPPSPGSDSFVATITDSGCVPVHARNARTGTWHEAKAW